jgi:hypothetical protein
MTYGTLVHEISHEQQKTTKELLVIATRHASGEEEVRDLFVQSNRKAAPGSIRGTSTTAMTREQRGASKAKVAAPM